MLAPDNRAQIDDLTRDTVKRLLAIVVGDKVVSTPRVAQEVTQDSLSIVGGFTKDRGRRLRPASRAPAPCPSAQPARALRPQQADRRTRYATPASARVTPPGVHRPVRAAHLGVQPTTAVAGGGGPRHHHRSATPDLRGPGGRRRASVHDGNASPGNGVDQELAATPAVR